MCSGWLSAVKEAAKARTDACDERSSGSTVTAAPGVDALTKQGRRTARARQGSDEAAACASQRCAGIGRPTQTAAKRRARAPSVAAATERSAPDLGGGFLGSVHAATRQHDSRAALGELGRRLEACAAEKGRRLRG
jgi:hypothetical protein